MNRINFVVHVKYLALIKRERFNNVVKSMSMKWDCFLEGLAQQILARLRVRDDEKSGSSINLAQMPVNFRPR